MKHNTSELTGALLDAAVAKACGIEDVKLNRYGRLEYAYPNLQEGDIWSPSEDWAEGGPLIESEQISLLDSYSSPTRTWLASVRQHPDMAHGHGPTPLIAAMRALVAAKLGEEVELP